MYAFLFKYIHVPTHTHTYVYIYIWLYVCIDIYIYVWVCTSMFTIFLILFIGIDARFLPFPNTCWVIQLRARWAPNSFTAHLCEQLDTQVHLLVLSVAISGTTMGEDDLVPVWIRWKMTKTKERIIRLLLICHLWSTFHKKRYSQCFSHLLGKTETSMSFF